MMGLNDFQHKPKNKDHLTGTCDICGKEMTVTWDRYKRSPNHPLLLCRSCQSTKTNKSRIYKKGNKSKGWKGGGYVSHDGYQLVKTDKGRGTYRREHTLVMEKAVGYPLGRDDCVHHIDGDKLNNVLENLILCSNSEHRKIHSSLEKVGYELIKLGLIVFDKETKQYKWVGDDKKQN